ncbi:MAG TPA: YbjN domain-containing protein [Synergistaceae bacterium]|nr:YbjN domain-containing protein [Synergistaceae bacterium]
MRRGKNFIRRAGMVAVLFGFLLGTGLCACEAADSENGLKAFELVGAFLQEDEWFPTRVEGKYLYKMGFLGDNGDLRCYAQVRVDEEQLIFYAVAPVKAPEEKRIAMAEFLTRANYGLFIGNFSMDFNDGEIRYKSSLDFEGVELSKPLIIHAIYPAVQTMDNYLPGIMKVITTDEAPKDIIAEIEG